MTKCYMCEKIATTNEHVPPKCFFPALKYSGGKNFRNNLITVKSCDDHNGVKSGDDEYLKEVISMHHECNEGIQRMAIQPFLNDYDRNEAKLNKMTSGAREVILNGQETFERDVDLDRIDRSITLIVCGLFFHHNKRRWTSKFDILTPGLRGGDESLKQETENKISLFTGLLENDCKDFYGANPGIFKYRLSSAERENLFVAQLIFYDGFEIFAASVKVLP